MRTTAEIVRSWLEYRSLPEPEWRKDYFSWTTGGHVATHYLKTRDDMSITGIAAEVKACHELASIGKHILRLPENIPEKIDLIVIDGKPYRDLLKFKPGYDTPRGYPDAYFDRQTWDFKTSTYQNEDSLRQTIKDGRKADNIVFLTSNEDQVKIIQKVIHREIGMREKDESWKQLPDIYYYSNKYLKAIWVKR